MQAAARKRDSLDLAAATQLSYGAPPLLEAKLLQGELDAVLTFWNFAARLESQGCMQAISVADCAVALGLPQHLGLIGFVFREEWAAGAGSGIEGFIAAAAAAQQILAASPEEWLAIRPLMGAPDDRLFARLRERFVAGIATSADDAAQEKNAAALFALLRQTGGAKATEGLERLPDGVFWRGSHGGYLSGVPPGARSPGGTLSRATFYRVIGLGGFVVFWFLASRGAGPLLPSPVRVALFLWHEAADGDLLRQMGATLARVAVAFVLAMLVGGVAGYAMGRSPRLNALADPWLVIALNLPLLVIVILAYIWIGLNDCAAVLAVVVAKAPTVMVTVREGAKALDPGLDEMARVFQLPFRRRLCKVVLPQLAPYLAASGRSGLSITWKIVLVVELLGRPNGVGFALNLAFQNFNVTAIIGYGLAFALVMLLVEGLMLQPLEQRANRWRAHA